MTTTPATTSLEASAYRGPRHPRVLFYAVNGLGLGHVTRLLGIARRVRDLVPAEVVFLTSSEAEDVIFREGFAAFKVPSRTARARGMLRPQTYARMVQTVTLNLVASFQPHVLVVDTFPAGALQELLPVLRWEPRKVFVYRAQRPEAAEAALFQNALRLYDLVLVPHAPGEEQVTIDASLECVWTGPIVIRETGDALGREEARGALGLPLEGPVVYVTFGGGGDREMDTALRVAVDTLSARQDVHLAVARAPLHRGSAPRGDRITHVHHYPMAEMAAAFDAAVSAAGYNTTMELLHHGVPTALVPFPRQVDDQERRARRLAAAQAALCVCPLTADGIRQALDRLLEPAAATLLRDNARAQVPPGGALRAAEAITGLLAS